nr:NADH dehydrogenase subunit 3 [Neoheterobothrium hirame]
MNKILSNSNYLNFSYNHFVSSFECGFTGANNNNSNFSTSVLLLLVFFVLLDVEIVLFLNCGLNFPHYGSYYYYLLFLVVVLLGFFYEVYWGLVRYA